MAKTSLLAAIIALLVCGCVSHVDSLNGPQLERCELRGATTILMQEGDSHAAGAKLLQRRDIRNDGAWDGTGKPRNSGYQQYLDELSRSGLEKDPARILKVNDTFNNRIVGRHLHDWMKPASCLEKVLLSEQHARLNMFSAPTEFASFALLSPDGKTVRVYVYTVNQNGIGKATPLTTPVREDVHNGWIPLFVLHNHPIVPGDDRLNGAPSPSVPDADFQNNSGKYLGLPQARITNGVNTVHIPASAFGTFRLQGSEGP